jgi:hypothetical protein
MRIKTRSNSATGIGKKLTLGDLISATYGACGEQRAPQIVQFAIDSHLVRFEKEVSVRFPRP